MIVSGNELYATTLKACVGSEMPRGVAEDLSSAAVALAQLNFDPTAMIVHTIEQPMVNKLQWAFEAPNWICREGNVSALGPSIVDFAQLVRGSGYAHASDVDHIELVYGCALAVSQAAQFDFEIRFESESEQSSGVWMAVDASETLAELPQSKCHVSLRCVTKLPERETSVEPIRGLSVHVEDWAKLKRLSERILVPANDANRADAGAGNTDND